MEPSKTLEHILSKTINKPKLSKIAFMEFIHFGLVHNLIRRVYEYPMLLRENLFDIEDVRNYNLLPLSEGDITDKDVESLNKKVKSMAS